MKVRINGNQDVLGLSGPFELVERKGLGHPDTICDQIAENASMHYSRYGLEQFNGIPHHWFDKVILVGGRSDVGFGFGELKSPYTVIFCGKACFRVGLQEIPIEEILFKAACEILQKSLIGFDSHCHLSIECKLVDYKGAGRRNVRYQPRSGNDLCQVGDVGRLYSNDCNLVCGYAPLGLLEQVVLSSESYLNSEIYHSENPRIGTDIKVIGSRSGDNFQIIYNIPFLGKEISDEECYRTQKEKVMHDIEDYIRKHFDGFRAEVLVNPQDRTQEPYLTALGSAADTGDVGVVGRGNRINGLITPMRPMSIEAPAGKNPLDHSGKILMIASNEIANKLYEELREDFCVHIMVSKGSLLARPDMIEVSSSSSLLGCEDRIQKVVMGKLENLHKLAERMVFRGIAMW